MRELRHTVPRGRGRAGGWGGGGGGLGQEGQGKGSTYATAYSTGTHGKATHNLRPKAICVGVQGKICRCAPPPEHRSSGGRASILKPVRATAAETECNRRLWMFGVRNGIRGRGGATLRVTPCSSLYLRVCQLGRSVSGFKTGTKRMLCGGRAEGDGEGDACLPGWLLFQHQCASMGK